MAEAFDVVEGIAQRDAQPGAVGELVGVDVEAPVGLDFGGDLLLAIEESRPLAGVGQALAGQHSMAATPAPRKGRARPTVSLLDQFWTEVDPRRPGPVGVTVVAEAATDEFEPRLGMLQEANAGGRGRSVEQ